MHVLKKIRNNIESSRKIHQNKPGRLLLVHGNVIVWDHWIKSYEFNNSQGISIHRNLTEGHIYLDATAKMRNSLAIEVLNKDMLFLMKLYQATLQNPEDLSASISLLEHTSILVNIFCNVNQPIETCADQRLSDLQTVLDYFNSWEQAVQSSTTEIVQKHLITRETREDINSSITGFISLCSLLLGKGNTINPGYLNSNLVENHFGQQRGIRNGLNTNPTLAQYGSGNTATILGQCTISSKCNSGQQAAFYKATTPCALNPGQNKRKRSGIRL